MDLAATVADRRVEVHGVRLDAHLADGGVAEVAVGGKWFGLILIPEISKQKNTNKNEWNPGKQKRKWSYEYDMFTIVFLPMFQYYPYDFISLCISYCWWFRNPKQPPGMVPKPW